MRRTLALLLITLLPVRVVAQSKQLVQSKPLAFTHATIIDMTGAKPKQDMTLIIVGNHIAAIGKSGKFECQETLR